MARSISIDAAVNAMQHVFTYGTLKRGQCRESRWPVQPTLVTHAWLLGTLYSRDDYPALLTGNDRVRGERWSFNDDQIPTVLSVLDGIEGTTDNAAGDLYHRHLVAVSAMDETSLGEAYAYFYNRDPIADGFTRVNPRDGYCCWP